MLNLGDFLHSLTSEAEHMCMRIWDRMSHALGTEGLRSALSPHLSYTPIIMTNSHQLLVSELCCSTEQDAAVLGGLLATISSK